MPTSSQHLSLTNASPQSARKRRRLAGFATLAAAIVAAQGCVAAPSPVGPEARVIVRFRPGSPDPYDAAFRARLASSARVSHVDLLRPMSGDAYVMTIGCADPNATTASTASDACASAITRLGATEWVASIENDGREKHQ
ncbi:MAG: hypothetical protein ACR2GP_02965 [Burkholderiaceae bacterium]